jgi:hypothetical protein
MDVVILRAVMFAEFMVESFYSRARRIAGYVTVSATPLSDKMADQKTANVTARSIVRNVHEIKSSRNLQRPFGKGAGGIL